jgi:hypothetical protein
MPQHEQPIESALAEIDFNIELQQVNLVAVHGIRREAHAQAEFSGDRETALGCAGTTFATALHAAGLTRLSCLTGRC